MSVTNHIRPFNEFWMNCWVNHLYSIAVSYEPSYKDSAYLNLYRYYRWEAETDRRFKYPTLDTLYYAEEPDRHPVARVIASLEPYELRDEQRIMAEIQELLREGFVPVVSVDLYYWLPGSLAWQSYHWNHYTLVTGIDMEAQLLHVIDDDLQGYRAHTIPFDRAVQAIMHSDDYLAGVYRTKGIRIFGLHKEIAPYRLTREDVAEQAARLIGEIEQFDMDGLWNLEVDDTQLDSYVTYSLIGINIIKNRQAASELLFQSMHRQRLVPTFTYARLSQAQRDVAKGWNDLRLIFQRKQNGDPQPLEAERLRDMAREAFRREQDMWRIFG